MQPNSPTRQSATCARRACSGLTTGCRRPVWRCTGLSQIEAQDLLRRLARTFPAFTAWAERVINVGQLAGYLSTVFGWTVRTDNITRTTTLRNFPMQANGAEM